MCISKWLLIVAFTLPISTFAIAPAGKYVGFIEVGTVVSAESKMIEFPCTGEGADKCTTSFTVTNVVTTKGRYTVKGHAAVSVGETMTKQKGYFLCGESHTATSLEPICYPIMIGITYRE